MKLFNFFRKEKYNNLQEYVTCKIGNIHLSIPSQTLDDEEIEVIIVEPTKQKPYYTLITNGLSNYEMKIPRQFESNSFCELKLFLPKDWKVLNPNINYYWPIKSLFQLANDIVRNYGYITFGSIISFKSKIADNMPFNSFLFVTGVDDEVVINNKHISLYSVIPIYNEEVIYAKQHSGESLFNNLVDNGLIFPPIIDIKRKNIN